MQTGSGPLAGKSVLVVDDETFIAAALELYMLDAGASRAASAHSLADAGELLRDHEFDAAILDVTLPDGDCTALAQELIAGGTHVILHSGAQHAHVRAAVPGADHCLKPAGPELLVGLIEKALSAS